jgi:hypothetical protein
LFIFCLVTLFYFAINPFRKNELKKVKVQFNEKLNTEFLFLKVVEDECVTCTKCLSTFTIHHAGCSDVTDHMKTRRHKSVEEASASTSNVSSYFKTAVPEDNDLTHAAAEGAFTCHCEV